jgi:hypothetical protein
MTSAMVNNNCEQYACERSAKENRRIVFCVYLTALPADPSSGKCKYYTLLRLAFVDTAWQCLVEKSP